MSTHLSTVDLVASYLYSLNTARATLACDKIHYEFILR